LKELGLKGIRLFVSDKCLGPWESFIRKPCGSGALRFYRNMWTAVPTSKVKESAENPEEIAQSLGE
jgi:putative transposase